MKQSAPTGQLQKPRHNLKKTEDGGNDHFVQMVSSGQWEMGHIKKDLGKVRHHAYLICR